MLLLKQEESQTNSGFILQTKRKQAKIGRKASNSIDLKETVCVQETYYFIPVIN